MKSRDIFCGNNFPLSDILCSELLHHFLEKFKFYSSVHVTLSVLLNTRREEVFFWWRRDIIFSKANKQFLLKKSPYDLSDVELTRRVNCPAIYKITQFHLFDVPLVHQPKVKTPHKFSPTTH